MKWGESFEEIAASSVFKIKTRPCPFQSDRDDKSYDDKNNAYMMNHFYDKQQAVMPYYNTYSHAGMDYGIFSYSLALSVSFSFFSEFHNFVFKYNVLSWYLLRKKPTNKLYNFINICYFPGAYGYPPGPYATYGGYPSGYGAPYGYMTYGRQ